MCRGFSKVSATKPDAVWLQEQGLFLFITVCAARDRLLYGWTHETLKWLGNLNTCVQTTEDPCAAVVMWGLLVVGTGNRMQTP